MDSTAYLKLIYDHLQEYWPEISEMLQHLSQTAISVNMLVGLVRMLLQAVIFFGLLNLGFKFIKARWLTVC